MPYNEFHVVRRSRRSRSRRSRSTREVVPRGAYVSIPVVSNVVASSFAARTQ